MSKNALFTANSHDLNIRLSLTSGCSCINWTSLGDRPIYSLPVLILLPSNINYTIKTCLWVWKYCFQRHCYKVFVIWKILKFKWLHMNNMANHVTRRRCVNTFPSDQMSHIWKSETGWALFTWVRKQSHSKKPKQQQTLLVNKKQYLSNYLGSWFSFPSENGKVTFKCI